VNVLIGASDDGCRWMVSLLTPDSGPEEIARRGSVSQASRSLSGSDWRFGSPYEPVEPDDPAGGEFAAGPLDAGELGGTWLILSRLGGRSVASRRVELLQAELDCIRWLDVLADFGPDGVSQDPGGQDCEHVAQAGDGPADAADVGAGVDLAHEAFQDAGGQFGAADAGQCLAEGGVQAGERVGSGGVQEGVGGGQGGRDLRGEGVPVGQGLFDGVLGADLFAQQFGELVLAVAGPVRVVVPVVGVVDVEGLAQSVG